MGLMDCETDVYARRIFDPGGTMGNSLRLFALLIAFAFVGCSGDDSSADAGTGGTAGSGGTAGTAGTAGAGGSAGMGGTAGMGGASGMGGSGSGVGFCTEDRVCGNDVDCVCAECDDDLFCSDPDSCFDNGNCVTFVESCICADCADLPACDR